MYVVYSDIKSYRDYSRDESRGRLGFCHIIVDYQMTELVSKIVSEIAELFIDMAYFLDSFPAFLICEGACLSCFVLWQASLRMQSNIFWRGFSTPEPINPNRLRSRSADRKVCDPLWH